MNIYIKTKDNFEIVNNSFNSNDLFRIVGNIEIETLNQPVNFATLTQIADAFDLDILIINDSITPKIVKVLDMQKYKYDLIKLKKENEKKQKALQIKNKEIQISLRISEHDLTIKINHAKEFANNGNKVKFLLRLRGREGTNDLSKKYAHEFFNNIITKFDGYNIAPVKYVGNLIYTEITK